MKTNSEYKNIALSALKGNWAGAVLATAVFSLLALLSSSPSSVFQLLHPNLEDQLTRALSYQDYAAALPLFAQMTRLGAFTGLISLLLVNVVRVGYANALLRLVRHGESDMLGNMLNISFRNYWHKVWGMFLQGLFIALWTCLFIIPGLIKVFSYAMTPFILEERPDLSANEAIDRSRAMMKGHKFDLFYLVLSFIGWGILCCFTFGIGFLWLIPYAEGAVAAFYEDVKAEYDAIAL